MEPMLIMILISFGLFNIDKTIKDSEKARIVKENDAIERELINIVKE